MRSNLKRKKELRQKLAGLEAVIKCPSCGIESKMAHMLWDAQYCHKCGKFIRNRDEGYLEYDSLFGNEGTIEHIQLKMRKDGFVFPDGFFDDERFNEAKKTVIENS